MSISEDKASVLRVYDGIQPGGVEKVLLTKIKNAMNKGQRCELDYTECAFIRSAMCLVFLYLLDNPEEVLALVRARDEGLDK